MAWALLLLTAIIYVLLYFSLATSVLIIVLLLLLGTPCFIWQLKVLNNLNQGIQQLQFVDGCWYLLIRQADETIRCAIELTHNNLLWPWWIRLGYQLCDKEQESLLMKLGAHKSLLICRDAVSESEFRHLSRVLHFFQKESHDSGHSN